MLFTIAIVLAFLPSLTWLLFYLREDPHPEPPRWLWLAFFIGTGAAPLSFYVEKWLLSFTALILQLSQALITESVLFMLFGIALVEELAKFLGARVLLFRNPVFDEPVDAMIYLITIALGFAAFENILVLNTAPAHQISSIFQTLTLRFIGANFLHTLSSGLIGYHWARGIVERNILKRLVLGISLATLLHAAFNLLIIKLGPAYFLSTIVLLFIAGLFVLRDFELLKQLKTPATIVKRSVKVN
ncbi:MAG: PrsW family intramembrane metalloprotease [Candidatus Paceibacteria bacterium]